MIAAYVGVSFWMSTLRYEEFSTSNWDLGIFQQALWSSAHGHPMYEAGDWESFGSVSLLQVHPGFILYLVAPLYALAPSPYTLFALQSVVVALAAAPLYLIGRRVIGRPWPAVVLAGFYLVAAPTLVANLYDYHLESFFPLEIALLFLFWLTARYALGLIVAIITLVTLEVAPFLVVAVALYFLWPAVRDLLRALWVRLAWSVRAGHGSERPPPGPRAWRDPAAQWATLLMLVAVLSYPLLRLVEWIVLPGVLPPAPNPSYATALIPGRATELGLAFTWSFTTGLSHKLGFWFVMVASFGFLSLLAPRALLLQVPWFLFTLQANTLAYSTIGFQYTFIAVTPMAIAAILGYPRAERWLTVLYSKLIERWQRRSRGSSPSDVVGTTRPRIASVRQRQVLLAVLVVFVVLLTYQIGPLNPHNQVTSGALPGYVVQYRPAPGFANVVTEAALIPSGAPVLASSNLFPLVANDLNAYALLWVPSQPNQLPFGLDHPPTYGFFATNQMFAVPGWFLTLEHHGQYGLRAVVWVAPTGAVFLYELGYTGATDVIGPT